MNSVPLSWLGSDAMEAACGWRLTPEEIEKIRLALNEEQPLPDAPCQFLFGFDDPFGDGGLYVWMVAEEFFKRQGYVDDSSTFNSAIEVKRWDNAFEHEEDEDRYGSEVSVWLTKATEGILYGEGMESCWTTGWRTESDREMDERLKIKHDDPYEGKTREEVVEQIKAALESRGFKHEPKMENW